MTSPAIKKIIDALRADHDEAVRLRLELEQALSVPAAIEAGPRPKVPDENLRNCLEDAHHLGGAFVFSDTPQGDEFWRAQYRAGKLSPEGRATLEKWIAE